MKVIAKMVDGETLVSLTDWELEKFKESLVGAGHVFSVVKRYKNIEVHRSGNRLQILEDERRDKVLISFFFTFDGIAIDPQWEREKEHENALDGNLRKWRLFVSSLAWDKSSSIHGSVRNRLCKFGDWKRFKLKAMLPDSDAGIVELLKSIASEDKDSENAYGIGAKGRRVIALLLSKLEA